MYRWRKISPEKRRETLAERRLLKRPWHSPRHHSDGKGSFLITSTCFEHMPTIGISDHRMDSFSKELCGVVSDHSERVDAWAVLPNHYHVLVVTASCGALLKALGRLHGRTSRQWNREENLVGRKVWFNTMDRRIETDAHHVTALQYVLHNPVKHGHVRKWDVWKWSSARDYIGRIGREEAERRWREHPLLNFGQGWDD
ncbi:MAG: hypothetical protein KDN05_17665 [Verrucomicrobiae bacterium]|nr:hypothetical protein [Verrucomicrobiae bacterium]